MKKTLISAVAALFISAAAAQDHLSTQLPTSAIGRELEQIRQSLKENLPKFSKTKDSIGTIKARIAGVNKKMTAIPKNSLDYKGRALELNTERAAAANELAVRLVSLDGILGNIGKGFDRVVQIDVSNPEEVKELEKVFASSIDVLDLTKLNYVNTALLSGISDSASGQLQGQADLMKSMLAEGENKSNQFKAMLAEEATGVNAVQQKIKREAVFLRQYSQLVKLNIATLMLENRKWMKAERSIDEAYELKELKRALKEVVLSINSLGQLYADIRSVVDPIVGDVVDALSVFSEDDSMPIPSLNFTGSKAKPTAAKRTATRDVDF